MAILKARENASDTFKPVATMGVGNASQSQRGLMTAQDKVKVDSIGTPSGETDTLWDKVEDLSTVEAITDESQVFSSIPSGKTITSFSFLKVGKIAQINFTCAFSPASATNQWVTFATLNSEYSPFGRFDTFTVNNNTDAPVHTRFNTNGDLQIWTSSAITTLVVSVVYILS